MQGRGMSHNQNLFPLLVQMFISSLGKSKKKTQLGKNKNNEMP